MKTYTQTIKGVYLLDYITCMGYFNQAFSCEAEYFKIPIEKDKLYTCSIYYNFDGFCEYFHLKKIHNL